MLMILTLWLIGRVSSFQLIVFRHLHVPLVHYVQQMLHMELEKGLIGHPFQPIFL
jgi:hypothetical protein